jgi:hypothetical protein
MASVKELQGLVDGLRSGRMDTEQMRDLLHQPSAVVRANALEARVVPAKHDRKLIEEMAAAASDPANRVRLMSTISVAHVAVGCLVRVGPIDALEAAKARGSAWPEANRTDLTWYLDSEGLQVG